MPYILPELRKALDGTGPLKGTPGTSGELNYVLTKKCLEFLEGKRITYAVLNEVIGALECAKQEFYRRMIVPLEEEKKAAHGDVF